jgi:signal transduction histidine kinase
VKVTISADGHDLRLVVADDGIGLSGGPRGHGTRNMAARAARLGGSFELRTGVDGVSIEWCVPVAPRPDDRPPGSDGNYPPDP